MPVAGFINRPEGKDAFQATEDNFVECLTETLGGVAGLSLNPIEILTSILNVFISVFTGAVGILSSAISDIMNVFSSMLGDIFGTFDRLATELFVAFIYLMDIIKRSVGIILASQYYAVFMYKFMLACVERILLLMSIFLGVIVGPVLTAAMTGLAAAIVF